MSGLDLMIALAVCLAAGFFAGYAIRDTRRWRADRKRARFLRRVQAGAYKGFGN